MTLIRKIVSGLGCLWVLLLSGEAYAHPVNFEPYVGVGASFVQMQGAKKQFINGRTITDLSTVQTKSFNTLDGYFGLKFTEYFGIEFGYQHSGNNKKTTNEDFIGDVAAGDVGTSVLQTQLTFRNLYLDFNGFLPLTDCWLLNASLGIAHLHPTLQYRNHVMGPNAGVDMRSSALEPVHSKNVLKAGLGVIYQFTEKTGLRLKSEYLNSSRLRGDFHDAHGVPDRIYPNAKLFKDTYLFSISIFTKLF